MGIKGNSCVRLEVLGINIEGSAIVKKQAVCFCVVAFVAVVMFTGCGEDEVLIGLQHEVNHLQKENEELKEDVDELQRQVGQVDSSAQQNGEGIVGLQTQVTDLNVVLVSDIRSQTDELNLQMDGLGARVGGNESDISLLDGQISEVIDGKVITAEEIRLVDENGNLKAKLYTGASGNSWLTFYDEDREFRSWLTNNSLGFFDENGEIRSWLTNNSLRFYDEDGEVTTTLSSSQYYIYIDDWLYGRFRMDIRELDGKPALALADQDGNILWSIPLVASKQGSDLLLSKSGLVVTNHHVVAGSSDIEVVFPQLAKKMEAEVVLQDENNDLAILRLFNFTYSDISDTDIPYQITSSDSVGVGESVFTMGFPLSYILGESPRVTAGNVNALNGTDNDQTVFQIDSGIQPGSSGSPLFNSNGQLVGIITSSLVADILQNVNFAVKSNYLLDLLPEDEIDDITHRVNLLAGKSLEEKVEILKPFMVVIKAR